MSNIQCQNAFLHGAAFELAPALGIFECICKFVKEKKVKDTSR